MREILILTLTVLLTLSCNQNKSSNLKYGNEDENLKLYNKADEELQNRNFTKAIKYCNEVIENNSIKNSWITTMCYITRGVAKGELMDNRGAISDFSYVINNGNISNYKPMAYQLRGTGKMKMNDYDGACYDWSKAGELGSDMAYELIKENCN